MRAAARVDGSVTAFDRERGLGEVTAGDGTVLMFHCIEIADGTRDIDVDCPVSYVERRKLGRLEAADLRPR